MDTEAQKVPEAAAPPPSRRRRRLVGAAAFVALVLLSLGELLLPLADVGAADARVHVYEDVLTVEADLDARVEIGFDGKDVLIDVDARVGRADVGERQQQLAEREQDQRDESGRADQAAAAAARRRRSRLRHFLRLRVHQFHALRRRPASCRLPRNANPRRAGPSTSTPVLWALAAVLLQYRY